MYFGRLLLYGLEEYVCGMAANTIELIKYLLGRCKVIVSLTMMAVVETGKNNGLGKNT
jgi:hypothetical protein